MILHVNRATAIYAPDGIVVGAPVEDPLELRGQLARLRPEDPRVKFEHKLADGEPAEQIVKAAAGMDLIVLGTHGTTGLARLLMGSVAETVLRKAPCPVLTVRTKSSEAAKS